MVRAETGFVKEQYKLILRWERRYTAGHDPETSKTIYKNVLGRTQEEAKEKLNAAIKETQSLDLQKLYKKLLTKDWVDRLEAKGQPKGLSAKTVRNIHQILSSALKLAQKQRIILTNPAEGRANAHQGEQDHPYDGKHDAWRGKRRLGNDLGIELCTVPGQPAGQAAHRLGEEDPSPIGPP